MSWYVDDVVLQLPLRADLLEPLRLTEKEQTYLQFLTEGDTSSRSMRNWR